MRIISGRFKSRRFQAPKNLPVRPTTDIAKEALFNILNNDYFFEDISVLDLFSGIGSISFEFSSRGTNTITSVDKNRHCIQFISQTAEKLGIAIDIVHAEAIQYLNSTSKTFDIIFADPPYDYSKEEFMQIANSVFENNLLNTEGILIIEHSKHTDLSEHHFYDKSRKYGHSVFSFFEVK